MENIIHWSAGSTIIVRGVWKSTLWWACPAFVVQDTAELIALYWPLGTPTWSPIKRPTVEDMLNNRIELEDRAWSDTDVLSLAIPGSAYSLYLMWKAGTWSLQCWYVDLQEPLRRTKLGFDTMDQILDIVIHPDRSHWHWKDEDEFRKAEAIGVFSSEKAQAIRAEGERVIGLLNQDASPFSDGWENWRPPGEWSFPGFPTGWEVLPFD